MGLWHGSLVGATVLAVVGLWRGSTRGSTTVLYQVSSKLMVRLPSGLNLPSLYFFSFCFSRKFLGKLVFLQVCTLFFNYLQGVAILQ